MPSNQKGKCRFAGFPSYCFVFYPKSELLTIFWKYIKTKPKMKWCFFQVCVQPRYYWGKEIKMFVPWTFCNVSWIRVIYILSLWLYLVKYHFSLHVFKLSFPSKGIKIVVWYNFNLCVFVCASAHIFGAFKLFTLWPIFIKLGMSVTTVEDTWS